MWSEKKKPDAAFAVPSANLAQDRKRRVIDNNAAVWVGEILIIAAGIKRPDDRRGFDLVTRKRPRQKSVVDIGRGVAIVRRQFWLELVDERVVLFCFFAFQEPGKVSAVQLDGRSVKACQLNGQPCISQREQL